jgi:hypothetical protein
MSVAEKCLISQVVRAPAGSVVGWRHAGPGAPSTLVASDWSTSHAAHDTDSIRLTLPTHPMQGPMSARDLTEVTSMYNAALPGELP